MIKNHWRTIKIERKTKKRVRHNEPVVKCTLADCVVGFLRPVSSWNDAKQSEYVSRKTFKVE